MLINFTNTLGNIRKERIDLYETYTQLEFEIKMVNMLRVFHEHILWYKQGSCNIQT